MKLSKFIDILKKVKKECGDKHIWALDTEWFPCPEELEFELTSKLEKGLIGYRGGGSEDSITAYVSLSYKGTELEGFEINAG